MILNENELVEIDDGSTTDGQKKYLTPEGKIIYGPFVWSDKNDGEELSDEETAEILAYLDRCKEENPPEPLSLAQMIEESRQSYSEIPMFDYGTGKMSNRQAMADFYGWAIVDKILHEIEYSHEQIFCDRKPGQISKQLWQRIKDIRAGILPKAERKKIKDQCKHLRPQSEAPACQNKNTSEPETKPEKKEKPKIEIEKREATERR